MDKQMKKWVLQSKNDIVFFGMNRQQLHDRAKRLEFKLVNKIVDEDVIAARDRNIKQMKSRYGDKFVYEIEKWVLQSTSDEAFFGMTEEEFEERSERLSYKMLNHIMDEEVIASKERGHKSSVMLHGKDYSDQMEKAFFELSQRSDVFEIGESNSAMKALIQSHLIKTLNGA